MKKFVIDKNLFKSYIFELPNYFTSFIIPILFMTAGPMLLEMSGTLGHSVGNLSLIFTFFNAGSIIGQLTSVFYNRWLKKLNIIITGYIVIIPCLVLLSLVKDLYLFYVLYFIIGYATGVIFIQTMKYILENRIKNKNSLITILFNIYIVGHITAPFIASYLLNNDLSWRYSYYIMCVLVVIIIIFYIIFKKNKSEINSRDEEKEVLKFKEIFINRKLNIIFIFTCLLIMFYSMSEIAVSSWVVTFLRSIKLFDIKTASLALSLFWIALIIGRLIVSFLSEKLNKNYIILFLSVIALTSMILFIPLKSNSMIMALIAFAGLGYSGIATLGMTSAITIYEKGRGVLVTTSFAAINIGLSAAPLIIRFLTRYNMSLPMALAPLFMLLTLIIIIIIIVFDNKYVDNHNINLP